jgi:hypothetical protein
MIVPDHPKSESNAELRGREMPNDLKMRTIVALIAIMFLTVAAHAEGSGKGKKHQQDAPKAEDQTKKKAAEEAYKSALKSVPISNEKPDPWKTLR